MADVLLSLSDLRDVDALRAYFEVKPIQDFVAYLNYGKDAADAISAGQAPPPAPVKLPDLQYVMARIQKIDAFVVTLGDGAVVPDPDESALNPSPDLKQKVQEEVSRQTAYMYGLQSRADLVNTIQDKLAQLEQASYGIKDNLLKVMSWFSDNTVPLPGGLVLDDALLDLDTTIPHSASKAINDAKAQAAKYQAAIQSGTQEYAKWDAAAQAVAAGWDWNAYQQQQKQSIDDAGADAKGTQTPAGPAVGGPTVTPIVTPGGADIVSLSNIPGVPIDVTVEVYNLRADWDPYPPLEAQILIPPGGSLSALTMFPDGETTLDIYAVASGGWTILQSFRDGAGAVGEPLYWTNELDVPVSIQALCWRPAQEPDAIDKRESHVEERHDDLDDVPSYSNYPEQDRDYLDETGRFSFNQLAVFNWGYVPEAVDPPPLGSPNQAILVIAKSDVLPNDARPSMLPVKHTTTLEQLNVLAEVQFLNRPMNIQFPGVDGDPVFWEPLEGAIKDNFAESITLGAATSFVFTGQTTNPGGAPLPTYWNGQWFNPELLVVAAGSQDQTQPRDCVVLISFQRNP